MPQRRPQVVRDGVAESFELLIGSLQLRRAFDDALLQLGVQVQNLRLCLHPLADVANVALDDLAAFHLVDVADELDLVPSAVVGF